MHKSMKMFMNEAFSRIEVIELSIPERINYENDLVAKCYVQLYYCDF